MASDGIYLSGPQLNMLQELNSNYMKSRATIGRNSPENLESSRWLQAPAQQKIRDNQDGDCIPPPRLPASLTAYNRP